MKNLVLVKIFVLVVVLSIIALSASAHTKESPCYSNGGHGAKLVYGHESLFSGRFSKTPYATPHIKQKHYHYRNANK